MTYSPDRSPAIEYVERFRALGPGVAPRVVMAAWDRLSVVEQAAVAADWPFWARPKQLAPSNPWRTWGFLTGRGFGKTVAISNFINAEVEAGRATLIGLAAQDEASSVDIQINGPSGLIATAPPWLRPHYEASALQLVWPNGARAYVRTPEVPGKIRGLEYHLSWISEIQSWPNATREEAFSNFFLSTRLGYARVVWDASPKRRHPLIKELLARHADEPAAHVVVRGTTHENAVNLGDGYVEDMVKKFGGTQRGREELLGEMLADSENALVRQEWIDSARRPAPSFLLRRVVSIDPAVTARRGSDTTGIVEAGVGSDGHAYVFANATGKYEPSRWVAIALDWYVQHDCDLIIAETNKGGALVTETLRVIAKDRGLEVVVVGKDERPRKQLGRVFVKEVYAKGSKSDRAEPIATAYERRRISHVIGADLSSLEDTLTTWEPSPTADSPGDLDALVHAVVDLLDLGANVADPAIDFRGIAELGNQLRAPIPASSISTALANAFAGLHDRI